MKGEYTDSYTVRESENKNENSGCVQRKLAVCKTDQQCAIK